MTSTMQHELNQTINQQDFSAADSEGCTKCGAEFDHENVVNSSTNDDLVTFKCFECGFVETIELPVYPEQDENYPEIIYEDGIPW